MGRGSEQGLHFSLISRAFARQQAPQLGRFHLSRLLQLAQFNAQLQALGCDQTDIIAVLAMRAGEVLRLAGGVKVRLQVQRKRLVTVVAGKLFHGLIIARPRAKIYAW